jgi:hypothetical protein
MVPAAAQCVEQSDGGHGAGHDDPDHDTGHGGAADELRSEPAGDDDERDGGERCRADIRQP